MSRGKLPEVVWTPWSSRTLTNTTKGTQLKETSQLLSCDTSKTMFCIYPLLILLHFSDISYWLKVFNLWLIDWLENRPGHFKLNRDWRDAYRKIFGTNDIWERESSSSCKTCWDTWAKDLISSGSTYWVISYINQS